jgi:dienelactone hydrolase
LPRTPQSLSTAPRGELATFEKATCAHGGVRHDVYRKGTGPAVLVLTEIPGISPQVLGFADRVAALGCTAVVPDLFGTAGREPFAGGRLSGAGYVLRSLAHVCISREFTIFAAGRSSPVVDWLRALGAAEHARCGGPGIGVVGMCLTGGFALGMAVDARVLAPVLSQPALPVPISARRKGSIDCGADALETVARRSATENLCVLGLRFKNDPAVPAERFEFLRRRLGAGFVAVELEQADGHPDSPMRVHHSVLTVDLIDEPGQPTREALEQVLGLLRARLLSA